MSHNSPSWEANLPTPTVSSLFSHTLVSANGNFYEGEHHEPLTARVFKNGRVLRPSFNGFLPLTVPLPSYVSVSTFPANKDRNSLLVVELGFNPEYADQLGRPIIGLGADGNFQSGFGDIESTDMGIQATRACVRQDGTASMIKVGENNNMNVCTGVTFNDITSFVFGCMAFVSFHRSKQGQIIQSERLYA